MSDSSIVIRAVGDAELPALLAIYNDAVARTTATYDYEPRTLEQQRLIVAEKQRDGYPLLGAFATDGALLGFATYGLFRSRPGWRFAVEHSVYVAEAARGRGIASALMRELMAHARGRGYHNMVGVVDAANRASIAMHEKLGFTVFGVMKEGGYKFDRWLDVAFVQALL
jgi:L-amino acid N-acyltransferase YncA